MFDQEQNKPQSRLEEAIASLHDEMAAEEGYSKEYTALVDNLVKLYQLREHDMPRWMPKADTVVQTAGTLLGIAMIVNFERTGVITTKALTMLPKLR